MKTLSDLADACSDGSLILGGPAECPTRPFCQPGLEETYGLKFASFQEYGDTGGPLTKAAIQQGDVSIGLVFSSDGALATEYSPRQPSVPAAGGQLLPGGRPAR